VKFEEVYLKPMIAGGEATAHLAAYLEFNNTRRPHRAFDGKTPDALHYAGLPTMKVAA
jgi:putative transposase